MGVRERLVASVTDIRNRGQRLVQLNLELLTNELKEKGRRFGAAIGLFVGAGVLALYAVGFAMATATVALALVLPLWLALLLVTLLLFAIIAIMVLVGRGQIRRATKPVPDSAAAEAKKSAELLQENLRRTADSLRARSAPGRSGPGAAAPPPQPPTDAGATES
jgi:ABC-type transport system involved in Fe-S cluster assembly fused permease/ATPase subunit